MMLTRKEIRTHYKDMDFTIYDPYTWNFVPYLTHIESCVWSDIRCYGLPMYAQFPILGYFADFADPIKKIVIECDGKGWHDAAKDANRDADMNALGWRIYRIPGWKCIKDINYEDYYEDDTNDRILRDLDNSSIGVIQHIKKTFYGDED
jgi:hypothetical protein